MSDVELFFSMEPNEAVERSDFFEQMMRPVAPNEMVFQIDRRRPRRQPDETLSQEAVDEIAEQFRMFLMARLLGETKRTGLGPQHVRATVTLDFNPRVDPVNDPEVGPYFQIGNDEGLEPLDGTKRYDWRH